MASLNELKGKYQTIIQAMKDPNTIQPGQELKIPAA